MAQVIFSQTDAHFDGNLSSKTLTVPVNVIKDAQVASDAKIGAAKLVHQFHVRHSQKDGTDVVTETMVVFNAKAAGTLVRVAVVPIIAPTGGDKAFTVDVQKGNQSTAFATVLSPVVTINNTVANREVKTGTITVAAFAANDTIKVVLTTSGTTGSQGQGVLVQLTVQEDPS